MDWTRVPVPGIRRATALAVAPPSAAPSPGRAAEKARETVAPAPSAPAMAVGDEEGVSWRDATGLWRRLRTRAPVNDVYLETGDVLWVATAGGLFRAGAGGQWQDLGPGPGERARDVRRLVPAAMDPSGHAPAHRPAAGGAEPGTAPGARATLAVLTAAGVFVVAPGAGAPARRVRAASEEGVHAAAWDGDPDLWAAVDRTLVESRQGGVSRHPLPLALGAVQDLAWLGQGGGVAVLGARALAWGWPGAPRLVRLPLEPGAGALRLAASASGTRRWLWVLSDRGLLRAERPEGPWLAVRPPTPAPGLRAMAVGGGEVWLAGEGGVWQGRPGDLAAARGAWTARAPGRGRPPAVADCDPPVGEVHRRAVREQGLERERMEGLWRGVARRGLLPVVTLRGSGQRERSVRREYDEAFVSGDLRELFDTDRDRGSDVDVSLTLTWDLGELLYHPEQIDVSAEARRTLELRNDVLDEVNQLYFARQRALAAAARAAHDPAAAADARLRARELAGRLDAWTGGWFSRRVRCDSPGPVPDRGSNP